MYQINDYEGMQAETVNMKGHKGDTINAYYARPLGKGPHHGYATISPNLYFREGHGTPEDVGAKVRAAGGVPDDQVLGDLDGALKFLRSQPDVGKKVGVFATCSGWRHGFLAACKLKGFDALVECWG